MKLELSPSEADFLMAQLRRHLQLMEIEAAKTEKHQLQHALALDADALRTILDRLTQAPRD
jgi:hypothetical protein